jgi:PPOX class probable F420-dependent enzyme
VEEHAPAKRATMIIVVSHCIAGTLPDITPYGTGYAVGMSNTRTGVSSIDPADPRGTHMIEGLANDRICWLTTVAADGTPQTSPIWFLWSENDILIYSLDSSRTRNIANQPRVSMHLDGNGLGGDILVMEGTAAIDETAPSCDKNSEYLTKYEPVMDGNGWTPEWFSERYSMPIRIAVTKYRYW